MLALVSVQPYITQSPHCKLPSGQVCQKLLSQSQTLPGALTPKNVPPPHTPQSSVEAVPPQLPAQSRVLDSHSHGQPELEQKKVPPLQTLQSSGTSPGSQYVAAAWDLLK